MFMVIFSQILVPLGVAILRGYMNSPSSKMDELILNNIKDGCQYLANKDNNSLDRNTAVTVERHSMTEGV